MTAASVTAAGRIAAKATATLTPPEKAAAGPMSAQAEHDTVPCEILRMYIIVNGDCILQIYQDIKWKNIFQNK